MVQIKKLNSGWASSFRRTQLLLGWWGVLLLTGGWLHDMNVASHTWDVTAALLFWFGLNVLGFVVSYLIAREFLASGMLFIWALIIILAFLITWLMIYPLKIDEYYEKLPVVWHLGFALAYLINGYYMDRRLWWLAGWEALSGVFATLLASNVIVLSDISNHPALVLGLSSGIPLLVAALPFWKERHGNL